MRFFLLDGGRPPNPPAAGAGSGYAANLASAIVVCALGCSPNQLLQCDRAICPNKLDLVSDGPKCGPCAGSCPNAAGVCRDAGLVCDAAHVSPVGVTPPACSVGRAQLGGGIVAAVAGDGIASITLNDFNLSTTITGGTISLNRHVAGCVPSSTVPCTYSVLAVDFTLADFEFDTLNWQNGLLRATGVYEGVDSGEGVDVGSALPFTARFDVDDQKTVIAQASSQSMVVQGVASVPANGGAGANLLITGSLSFTFGSYAMKASLAGSATTK
jgi:hypothetical protein